MVYDQSVINRIICSFKSVSTEMVQYDHFRLEFAQSQNDIQTPKSMPERSPSQKSVLSDLDKLFLHGVDEMENKGPEMDTNDID